MSAETVVKPAKPRSQSTLDTEILLALITQGDREAFEELYRAQLPLIRAVVFRLVRDFHQTEEVAQEVMLQIWQLADHFDPQRGSALVWINQLARTRAIDRVRHSQAVRTRDQWHADHNHVDSFDTVSETALLHMDVAHIYRGLAYVTPLQRQALNLAFFSEFSYSEIALTLEIPLSTLKTRVRDGLTRLRKKIEEFDRDHPLAA